MDRRARQQINTWQITGVEIAMPADAPADQRLDVVMALGYTDDDGTRWLDQQRVIITGADLLAAIAQPPVGATMYDALKAALYTYLRAEGFIPDDAEDV